MAFLNVKNRASSTLAAAITSTDTSLTVATGEGTKFPDSNFHITIDDEILHCTSRTADTLTVERAKEGTTAAAHATGAKVELRITAQIITELQQAFNPDMLLTYILNGTAVFFYTEEGTGWAICFPDTYTDLAIQSYVALADGSDTGITRGRMANMSNFYFQFLNPSATTADHLLYKKVAGANTVLATEAVDINGYQIRSLKLSCGGTTIKAYRADLVTAKLTATDTSFTSGKFGIGQSNAYWDKLLSSEAYFLAKKVAAGSPTPKPIAYFEVPIIGKGTMEDPYRVKMPEGLEAHPQFGKINKLALTYSALIPSDEKGQPLNTTALVRVFAQPQRQNHLLPEMDCIKELKVLPGIKGIDKVKVRSLAKGMDKKLKDEDLTLGKGWE